MNPTLSSWLAQAQIRDVHAVADRWRLAASARPRTKRSTTYGALAASAWRSLAGASVAPLASAGWPRGGELGPAVDCCT